VTFAARTGPLLTAAALSVSFLGAQAIGREGLGPFAWAALVAFAVSLMATLYVLLPKDHLVFALDGPELYVALYEFRDDMPEVHRRVAYWVAGFRADNQDTLDRLSDAYRMATLALVAQVLLWALHLSSIL
jgi:hypothetical protein